MNWSAPPTLIVEALKRDMREVKYLSVESVISPPTLRKFSVWATSLNCFMESLEEEYAVSEEEVMEKFSASVREPTMLSSVLTLAVME